MTREPDGTYTGEVRHYDRDGYLRRRTTVTGVSHPRAWWFATPMHQWSMWVRVRWWRWTHA